MISVIVPYKNAAGWIGRCVKSLRAQKGEARFLLVNDSSSDDGEAIAIECAQDDARFVFLDNRRGPGVSGARNTGLDAEAGDWITFLDADDEMTPDAFMVFDAMIQNRSASIYQANHLRHYAKHKKTVLKYASDGGDYDLDHLPRLWCMVWNKLYKSSLIQENQIRFDERLQFGEDELFNLEVLAVENRIRHVAREVVTVKRHFDNRESLSHTKSEEDLLRQARALEEYLQRHRGPAARRRACLLLSEHWGSDNYRNIFCPEE